MFSWQQRYLTRLLRSLVRYRRCHSNMKSIFPRHREISYVYLHISNNVEYLDDEQL